MFLGLEEGDRAALGPLHFAVAVDAAAHENVVSALTSGANENDVKGVKGTDRGKEYVIAVVPDVGVLDLEIGMLLLTDVNPRKRKTNGLVKLLQTILEMPRGLKNLVQIMIAR